MVKFNSLFFLNLIRHDVIYILFRTCAIKKNYVKKIKFNGFNVTFIVSRSTNLSIYGQSSYKGLISMWMQIYECINFAFKFLIIKSKLIT